MRCHAFRFPEPDNDDHTPMIAPIRSDRQHPQHQDDNGEHGQRAVGDASQENFVIDVDMVTRGEGNVVHARAKEADPP
jgi:hypothetical protein